MMLLRRISAWFNKPSTATRIRALEEQTRLSEQRTEALTGNWVEQALRPPRTSNPRRKGSTP